MHEDVTVTCDQRIKNNAIVLYDHTKEEVNIVGF